MSGRAQAANLTGMLSQLASDVGDMGKAWDWTHQNIRDYAAPELNTDDPASLLAYSEYAKRNGNHEDAQKYAQMATDLGVQQQKQAWTTKLSAYQNSADLLTRELRKEGLTPEQRAGAEKALEGIYSQMNTYGAQGAKYGGTGREGSDYRDTMEERENNNILTQQRILANRLTIEEQVSGTERLSRIAFPEGTAGDQAFERYSQRADMVTNGNYGAINADYKPFIMSSIEKRAERYEQTVQTDFNRHRDEFNSQATEIIGRTYSDDPEVAGKAEEELAALTTKYGQLFSSEEYKPYNDKGIDSLVTSARSSFLAANDAALARQKAVLDLEQTKVKYDELRASGEEIPREFFPNQEVYNRYIKAREVQGVNGLGGLKAVNESAWVRTAIESKMKTLTEAMPADLRSEVNLVLKGMREDSELFADVFDMESWSDEDAEAFNKAVNKQMHSTLDDAGNSILDRYSMIDKSTPEGRAEARQLVSQSILSAIESDFPSLYDQMKEEADEEYEGTFWGNFFPFLDSGTKVDKKKADAESARWNRIEGDLALGTGAVYKERLEMAKKYMGENFNKADFDRAWEEKLKEQVVDPQARIQSQNLLPTQAWRQ